MIRKLLILFIFFFPISLFGQQVPQYSLHIYNPYIYNPAYAGVSSSIEAVGLFRKQWVGLKGSPTTQNFNFILPIRYLNSGIGMNIENDLIGAERNTKIMLSYAYGISLGNETRLSFGLAGGLLQKSLDGTKLLAPEGLYEGNTFTHNDNYIPETRENAISYQLDAGIFLKSTNLDAGFGVLHLTESKIDYNFNDVTDFQFLRHYIGFIAYTFNINQAVSIRPAVFAKTDLVQSQVDFSVAFEFQKRFILGTEFRGYNKITIDALGLNAGFRITDNWLLMYAYDFSISKLREVNKGSHEVMLKYEIKKTLGRAKLPKIIYNPRLL